MTPDEKRRKRAANSASPRRPLRPGKQLSPDRATLTPHESTKVTGFGIQATYRMLRENKIPNIKVGMRFYIPRSSLAKWMETAADQQVVR